jgi:hypothetical protein
LSRLLKDVDVLLVDEVDVVESEVEDELEVPSVLDELFCEASRLVSVL